MTGEADAAVGLLLVDDRGWILLQLRDERAAYPLTWGTVGGGVHMGESLEAALAREVDEETGYRISHPVHIGSRGTVVLPDGRRRTATVFVGRYDASQAIECHEGLQIVFVDPAALDTLAIYPGQRELIIEALHRFRTGLL